ncbi:MAG: flagellar biosynthesis protein [Dethiobacter sp.]|nr:flagellar biosynthesis protein [Dethiobacter sp.]MBS3947243.1 flagellar biosynthesis protein [Dethiobacter sp.]
MDFNVVRPTQPVQQATTAAAPASQKQQGDFARVWQETLQKQELKFSAHALQRMQARRIELGEGDLAKINAAMVSADRKGVRSSLLLYNDVAMVASVRNKTIITAMNGEELREHIFTNIDSAVIIR